MRLFCFVFLLLFGAAVGMFAYFNQDATTIRFFDWSWTTTSAMIAGIAYVVGMLSGWTVMGMIRRSANRVAEGIEHRYDANRI